MKLPNHSHPVFKAASLAVSALVCLLHPADCSAGDTVNTATLNSYDGTHPRLLLDQNKINAMRSAVTYPPAGTRWAQLRDDFMASSDQLAVLYPEVYTTPSVADYDGTAQWDTAGRVSNLSMAYLLTRGSQPSVDTKWIEAEDAVLQAPMTRLPNLSESGGARIGTPAGGSANNTPTTPSAVYEFSTLKTIYYHVWARIYAPNADANAFWYAVDDNAPASVSTTTYGPWVWIHCGSTSRLTPGRHQLKITYQKSGLLIDKFAVTSDYTLSPSGLDVEQHWLDASDFSITNTSAAQVNTADALATGDASLALTLARTAAPAGGTAGDAQQVLGLTGGTYDVWARIKCPTTAANTFYLAVDNAAYNTVTLGATSPTADWVWQKVLAGVALGNGDHVLNVSSAKTGCLVDRFFVAAAGTAAPVEPNKYLVAALRDAKACCDYPAWGTGVYSFNGLTSAFHLLSLSLFYDWCYRDLGAADLQKLATTLSTRGAKMYQGATGDTSGGVPAAWWRTKTTQNHLWTCLSGLSLAGLAIHGEAGMPDTVPWLQLSVDKIGLAFDRMGTDGADHEGAAYWDSIENPLQFIDCAKKLMGVDLSTKPWLALTGVYKLYFRTATNLSGPGSGHVNFSDTSGGEFGGPNYQLRKLASLYNLPAVQWLAGRYDDIGINAADLNPTHPANHFLNFLWYDPSVPETSPVAAGYPTFKHFPDLDLTISRTGWDNSEALVGFQCGPYQGHAVQAANHGSSFSDWGSGHEHPAANNFCFHFNGDWQIMNAGYTDKYTEYTNNLLVNGKGQLGEGDHIAGHDNFTFRGADCKNEEANGVRNPAINTTVSYSSPDLDYLVGEASGAYPATAGVTKFKRHLLYVKPDVLVVVDDVALSAAKPLELRFFPWQRYGMDANLVADGTGYLLTTGTKPQTKSKFDVLSISDGAALSTTTLDVFDHALGRTMTRKYLRLATGSSTPLANLTTAVSVSASLRTGTPRPVTLVKDADGTAWKFKAGAQTVVLNRNAADAANYEKARMVTCVEAESAAPVAPMVVTSGDTSASGGKYVSAPAGTAANSPDRLASPSVTYTVPVAAAGTYSLWARVYAADAGSASFYYAVNPGSSTAYTSVSATGYGAWTWVNLASATLSPGGGNVVALKYQQANCKIDQIIAVGDTPYPGESAYVPAGQY